MAAFQSSSSSCAIDALAVVCKRAATPANIVLQSNEEDDAHQMFMAILGGEVVRSELEEVSSLAVLWGAVVKVARTIDIGPPSDTLPDFSILGSDEGRFFGALMTTFEVLVENRPADAAALVTNLSEVFLNARPEAIPCAQNTLLQLIREYKDIFPFAYTFNRRANKYPKSAFDAVERYFKTVRQSTQNQSNSSYTDDLSMEDDDDDDDDTLSSSFPLEHFPSIATPSVAPPRPYPGSQENSPNDRNYGYSPHQASIVNSYYSGYNAAPPAAAGVGDGVGTGGGGYNPYTNVSVEEDEDSDVDNSALYQQQINQRKSKKRVTRMKKKTKARPPSAVSSLDDSSSLTVPVVSSIGGGSSSPVPPDSPMGKSKSVTFNDNHNEVMEISALDGTPPTTPAAATRPGPGPGAGGGGGGLDEFLRRGPQPTQSKLDLDSSGERSLSPPGELSRRVRAVDDDDVEVMALDAPQPAKAVVKPIYTTTALAYKPNIYHSQYHSKLSDSESSLELSDKERGGRDKAAEEGRRRHSVLSDDDSDDGTTRRPTPATTHQAPAPAQAELSARHAHERRRYSTQDENEEVHSFSTIQSAPSLLDHSLVRASGPVVAAVGATPAHVELVANPVRVPAPALQPQASEDPTDRAAAIERLKRNMARRQQEKQSDAPMVMVPPPPSATTGDNAGAEVEDAADRSDDELSVESQLAQEMAVYFPRQIPVLAVDALEQLCPSLAPAQGQGQEQEATLGSEGPPPRKMIAWDSSTNLQQIAQDAERGGGRGGRSGGLLLSSMRSSSSPHFKRADDDPIVVMRSLSQPPPLTSSRDSSSGFNLFASFGRFSLQEAPLTSVHMARLPPLSDLAQETGVIMEGFVMKQSNFMKMWQKRFLVLRESAERFCELCVYKQAVPSVWGHVPLRLKACIPILDIAAVEAADQKAAQGKEIVIRFAAKNPVATKSMASSLAFWRRSSSLSAAALQGHTAGTDGGRSEDEDARSEGSVGSDRLYGTKILSISLQAEDAEMRLLWVTMLNKVLRLAHEASQ